MQYTDLTGKTALITGAARGIGFESAKLMAECGAAVILADINLDGARRAAAKLADAGHTALPLQVDVSSEESIVKMIADAVAARSGFEILVNNAGILDVAGIPETTVEKWDRLMAVDLRSVHLCSQHSLPVIIKAGGGKIINIASQAGQLGGVAAGVHYTAAKGGAIALTKSYARYGAKFGINVNCVSPGFMLTEMTRDRGDDPEIIPLKRLGTALDVAKTVLFLATSLSDYITGATIDINGGYLMR